MNYAPLAELVDAPDLGSGAERCESSSLLGGTKSEGWLSGLRQQFAKLSSQVTGSVGSNPTPSTKCYKGKLCYDPQQHLS